ncbi:oxidoreductase [Neolentinus lepideus HHB14362 ss-1]|uniref:Oxidoreductase n=1 Tax=Neolentinus lepideus HHB14362 ss-1 TaxID=1314782 RepID=A0A165NU25_9AGAM|nr:oxidoreductase [Neolentinus lepideus HHB14362 ss-1]
MKGVPFNPDKDIPDLSGKVIFVTGGTSGIGKGSVLSFAKHKPAHIYFTGRNSKSATEVINEVTALAPDVQTTFLECDFASLASASKAIKRFTSERLDILVCNAGIISEKPALTKDGYEIDFGTNHLGHALIIKLLLPTLLRTAEYHDADVRIVILSSQGFRLHPKSGIVFKELQTTQEDYIHWVRYGQSKLANILYAAELARRYPQITTVSLHPGVAGTNMVANMSTANRWLIYVTSLGRLLTPEQGAYNSLWAATSDKGKIVNGEYYEPVGKRGTHDKQSNDAKLAEELWEYTETQLSAYWYVLQCFEGIVVIDSTSKEHRLRTYMSYPHTSCSIN